MDAGAALVEQGRALERRLTPPDDRDVGTGELRQVVVLRRVRHGRSRQGRAAGEGLELRRNVGELHVARGHDERARGEDLAGAQPDLVAVALGAHALDPLLLDRHQLLLEPAAVADEQVDRNRLLLTENRDADGAAEILEAVARPGRGEARRARLGLEEHALRHVVAPRVHRIAEDAHAHPPVEQVSGDREPIGARAHDDGSGRVRRVQFRSLVARTADR